MKIVKHFSNFFSDLFSEQLIAFVSEERSRGLVYPPGTYFYYGTVRHLSEYKKLTCFTCLTVYYSFWQFFSKRCLFLDHSLSN